MSDAGTEKRELPPVAETESDVTVEPARGRRRRGRANAADNSINMDELRELIQLIRENDFSEFELEREGFRVRFRRGDIGEVSPAAIRELQAPPSAPAPESNVRTSAPSHPDPAHSEHTCAATRRAPSVAAAATSHSCRSACRQS